MADPFLVISAIVLFLVIVAILFLILVTFSHENDKNQAYFPKFVVLLGLLMACGTVLVMPYDVANARENGGLRMDVLWQIIFIVDAIMLLFVIPYAFFFYESDQDYSRLEEKERGMWNSQAMTALKFTLAGALVFTILLLILFLVLGIAKVPVRRITQADSLWIPVANTDLRTSLCPAGECAKDEITWEIPVSFPIYVIALLSFFGWFLFTLFAGIGLVGLPVSLINEFRTRPTPITREQYAEAKLDLGRQAQTLIKVARGFEAEIKNPAHKTDRKTKRNDKKSQNTLETATYKLKNEMRALEMSYVERGGNPLWYFMKLCFGILGLAVSITWVVHIGAFMLPSKPEANVLNTLFIELEEFIKGFRLVGVVAFCLFTFYLLWCVVKAVFLFGLRIPFLLKIYPMEVGNTMMNAFLVNTWVILLCSVPVLQFSALAVPIYARNTDIDLIFGTQVQYLEFFTYFFANNVFIIALLCIAGLTLVYMVLMPKNQAKAIERKVRLIAAGDDSDAD